ncbi:hypothetical protein KKB99_06415, partial [bacterium]|nr:hypothetical protein [bacterium]MBU1025622.1 hypothetical protein [bacterium]
SAQVEMGPVNLDVLKKQGKATLNVIKVGGQDEQTSIIEYVVTLRNEERAIALCKAVSEVVIQRYKDILAESVVKSRGYLDTQVALAKTELDQTQKALEEFYLANPEFTRYLDRTTYSNETVRSESNIIDLQTQLASTNTRINAIEKDIKLYSTKPVDAMPVSIQSIVLVNDLRSKLIQMQLEKEQLLLRYSEEYPSVKKLTADIEENRKALYSTYLTLLKEQLLKHKGERDETAASLSSVNNLQGETMLEYNEFSVKRLVYDGLDRDLTIAENNYRLMREKFVEAKIREDEVRNRYTLAIIDAPNKAFPKDEFFHKPLFKIIFAFVGSLFFSMILVFLMDYFDFRYKSTTDVSMVLDLPILGEIPQYRAGK